MLNAPRMKVVVAEDDAVQSEYISLVLNKLGHDVLIADNGLKALAMVRETGAPLLITDLKMPGLNGTELTLAVRNLNLDHYVHIVMVTAGDQTADRKAALEAGVDDFMKKPLDIVGLTARIRAAVRIITHEAELAERNRTLKAAKDHIEEDLRAAAAAQRRLLPDFRNSIAGFRVASAFVPSAFVSGDMFGFFPLGDDKLGFYSVDVSGHGVRAALMSVAIGHLITPEFFRNRVIRPDGRHDPAALVSDLNNRFRDVESDEYFTMFCGIIDLRANQVDFCHAGSPSPILVQKDGSAAYIGDGGFPVGMLSAAEYENVSLPYPAGASLVICSDGAIEAENETGEAFGEVRLKQLVEQTTRSGPDKVPQKIIHALTAWRSGRPLEDDLTVVVLERVLE